MEDLVKRIKKLALANNITIAELERATGISNGRIAKWDNSIPGVDKVNLLAKYFDVSLDYLVNGNECINHISNSAIVQNNKAETLIVKNNGSTIRELSQNEEELLKIYNKLDLRKQIIFLSKIFEIENELNE